MRLVYDDTGLPVKMGDIRNIGDGEVVRVNHFAKPHKPASSGKVVVQYVDEPRDTREYYVGVIGATWIDREDR